jgi:peptidoglycan/LPS O-acetylase OafA/YrhL
MWAFIAYLSDGPRWYEVDIAFADCKDWWWANFLFINNFVPDWKSSRCMSWTWYLANDMQFFIITPPLLFLYHRFSRVIGWVVNLGFMVLSILTSWFIAD